MTKIFRLWRVLVQVGWAKSGTWANTGVNGNQYTYLLSIHITTIANMRALTIFVGPVSLLVGITP